MEKSTVIIMIRFKLFKLVYGEPYQRDSGWSNREGIENLYRLFYRLSDKNTKTGPLRLGEDPIRGYSTLVTTGFSRSGKRIEEGEESKIGDYHERSM